MDKQPHDPVDPTIGKDGKRYPLTAKQLKFIEQYMATGNASEAYRQAFPGSASWTSESLRSRASNLLANPKVAAEVNRQRQAAISNSVTTVETLAAELDGIKAAASEAGQHAAAVAATLGKAKLLGFMVDKVDQTVRQAKPSDHRPDLQGIRGRVAGAQTDKPVTLEDEKPAGTA